MRSCRFSSFVFAICVWVGMGETGQAARADSMALALSRLSVGACAQTLSSAENFALEQAGSAALLPDNRAFRRLAAQLSSAAAPVLLAPVTTRGPRGFDLAVDTTVTRIAAQAPYWQRATRGRAAGTCDGRNDDVAGALTRTQLRFVKGLPLGLSAGASLGKLHRTGLWTVGAELKLAVVEGLASRFAPAFALRLAATRVVGLNVLTLTAATLDAVVSWAWVARHALTLSPYFAAGALFTRARTGTVDLTPNIDANACALGVDAICSAHGVAASPADFAHERSFRPVSLLHPRGTLGLWLRYRGFAFASEAILDFAGPRAGSVRGSRQWGVHFAPSLSF